jgi:hypothetical protein
MSVTITWLPNTEADMDHYDVQRAPDSSGQPGTWADLVSIDHDTGGPNYDAASGRFFYADTTGTTDHWYRLRSVDTDNNASSYGNPFQPSETTTPPPFPNTVPIDESYEFQPSSDLVYKDPDGNIIADAQVRLYRKTDYDLGNFTAALGVTTTDSAGKWDDPITVEAGYTYVVQFYKPGYFGPDAQEIVVP